MISRLAPGQLLIAAPAMTDPNFEGTVVLLCALEESGAVGLVLNRPMGIPVHQVLPATAPSGGFPGKLLWGGPVGLNQVFLLHESALSAEIGKPIAGGLYFGGDLDDARRIAEADGQILFFVGYTGWGHGQLEEEQKSGGWLILPPDEREVWKADRTWQWEQLVARAAPDLSWMQGLERPDLN